MESYKECCRTGFFEFIPRTVGFREKSVSDDPVLPSDIPVFLPKLMSDFPWHPMVSRYET